MMKTLLFTDIDGTLIDHDTYSFDLAKISLKKLAAMGIPVIFCSSKTFAEQCFLQRKLKLNYPFIIENGSALAIPKGFFQNVATNSVHFSESHDLVVLAEKNFNDIQVALKKINALFNLNCFGYSESKKNVIAQQTGLKGNAIKRAKDRRFTESLFSEPPSPEALKMLNSFGLNVQQGGRFLTIQDKQVDKGKAVKLATQFFHVLWGEKPRTIGIGDSPNDASFLKVVDLPFLVQNQGGNWAEIEINSLKKIKAIGPVGFSKMVEMLSNF